VSDELSPRAREILAAAERMAAQHGRAPAGAARADDVTDEQLAALAEQVRVTVEAVRRRIAELDARVDALAAQLAQASAQAAAQPSPPSAPATPADDAPRLLAVELAVAGATRADVDARLRQRFGLSSTVELLDEVFGVGSAPSARLPWSGGSVGG